MATDSELDLFRKLADPTKTNFNRKAGGTVFSTAVRSSSYVPPPRTASVMGVHQKAPSVVPRASSVPPKPLSAIHESVHSHHEEQPAEEYYEEVPASPEPEEYGDQDYYDEPPQDDYVPPPASEFRGQSFNNTYRNEADEEVRMEKQGLLLELEAYRKIGVPISRVYTMSDPIDDIQMELDCIKNDEQMTDMVNKAQMVILFVVMMIEGANRRFGPILKLDGWHQMVKAEERQLKRPLQKLYKKYWRQRQMNPFSELAWVIGGSAAMTHLGNTMGVKIKSDKSGDGGGPMDLAGLMSMFGGSGGLMGMVGNMMGMNNKPSTQQPQFNNSAPVMPPPNFNPSGPVMPPPQFDQSAPVMPPPDRSPQSNPAQDQRLRELEAQLRDKDRDLDNLRTQLSNQHHSTHRLVNELRRDMMAQQHTIQELQSGQRVTGEQVRANRQTFMNSLEHKRQRGRVSFTGSQVVDTPRSPAPRTPTPDPESEESEEDVYEGDYEHEGDGQFSEEGEEEKVVEMPEPKKKRKSTSSIEISFAE